MQKIIEEEPTREKYKKEIEGENVFAYEVLAGRFATCLIRTSYEAAMLRIH